MCDCGEDGLKVEGNQLLVYTDGYDEWSPIENAKFCPFCGNCLNAAGEDVLIRHLMKATAMSEEQLSMHMHDPTFIAMDKYGKWYALQDLPQE